jgi:thiamine transport system substrate-binding protein
MLTKDFQKEIPLTNWMFPVNRSVGLPESFKYAPSPAITLSFDPYIIKENQKKWIDDWLKVVSR